MRLEFQLTSALLSSAGGRQAEFEEISEAGITSPVLIRASERAFFFFLFWRMSLGSQGAGGMGVDAQCRLLTQTWPSFFSPPESQAVSVTQCSVLFIYARPRRYRVQRCGLLIVLVQDSLRVNVAFLYSFFLSFLLCE